MNSKLKIKSCNQSRIALGKLANNKKELYKKINTLSLNIERDDYLDDEENLSQILEDNDDILYLDAPLVDDDLLFELYDRTYSYSDLKDLGAKLHIVEKICYPKKLPNYVSFVSDNTSETKYDYLPLIENEDSLKENLKISKNISLEKLKILAFEWRDDSEDEYCSFGFPRKTFAGFSYGNVYSFPEIIKNWGDHDSFHAKNFYRNSVIFEKIENYEGYEPLNDNDLESVFLNIN